jgi:hypothetical protein
MYECAFLRHAAATSTSPASAMAWGGGRGRGGSGQVLRRRLEGWRRRGGRRPRGPSRAPCHTKAGPAPHRSRPHLHRERGVPQLAAVVALHLHAVLGHPQVVVDAGGWGLGEDIIKVGGDIIKVGR